MRLFDVMSVFVVAIGGLVGAVTALLEPRLACGISLGFFLTVFMSLALSILGILTEEGGILILCSIILSSNIIGAALVYNFKVLFLLEYTSID
jgi:hypothetical protein